MCSLEKHVQLSQLLVIVMSVALARASSYLRMYGAKELMPYFRIKCDLKCPYGYLTDVEGNYVCHCLDPCQYVRCYGRTRCTVDMPKCHSEYCTPRATCRDDGGSMPIQADDATTTSSKTSSLELCSLPIPDEALKCRKSIMRWFFDESTGTCKTFQGCRTKGGNNFRGKRGCERKCLVKKGSKKGRRLNLARADRSGSQSTQQTRQPATKVSLCSLPVNLSKTNCMRVHWRWFFDQKTGTCRKFQSCSISGNNFQQKKHCKTACLGKNFPRTVIQNPMRPADQ